MGTMMKNLKSYMRQIRHYIKKPKGKKFIHRLEIVFFILVLVIFSLKISGYLHKSAFNPVNWPKNASHAYEAASYRISELKYFGKCPKGELKIDIGQQYLCRQPTKPSIYQKIYDTYPRNTNGDEVLYPFLDEYSINTANDFLKNQYDVPRYNPVTFSPPLTWNEDPYNNQYWRFNFYSLRTFKDLLDAYTATENPVYADKLDSIVSSFLTTGVNQPHAWDYYHSVAWRSMVLTDMWYKLRANNVMPINLSDAILASIVQHGNFLLDPTHYEANYNHGTNEAAALYELGVDFPNLPGASQWLSVGKERLSSGLDTIIDVNGALDEHSPYYNFYALEKYWDIYTYSIKYKQPISGDYNQRILSMINYATYILQPNLHVPIIGASLDAQIHDKDEFAQMAKVDPEFKYVLTKGKSGKKPASNNVVFGSTGQTIFRSGWNSSDYTQQTQLIFNYGQYLTQHSQLNSLSIQLYSGGASLLTGPGLYTYNPGPVRNYFSGTSSQNTVLVDGKSQEQGTGHAGQFISNPSFVSQSAADQLNPGVTHERQVTMIGKNIVVVIDKLSSEKPHTYQQLFHLTPGMSYSANGLTVTSQGKEPQQRLSITQIKPSGISLSDVYNNRSSNNPGGLCSQQYNVLLACHQVTYTQKTTNAEFVTLLQVGKPNHGLSYSLNSKKSILTLKDNGKTYTLPITESPEKQTKVTTTNSKPPAPKETVIDNFNNSGAWQVNNGTLQSTSNSYESNKSALSFMNTSGQVATMTKQVSLDLSNKNLVFRMKVPSTANVQDLDILLYSNNSSTYAQNRLKNSYDDIHDNDQTGASIVAGSASNNGWTTVTLGKGMQRSIEGQWSIYGSGFDWSKITSIVFRLSSDSGTPSQLVLGTLSTTPAQSEGKISIVFDDGTTSMLSAYPSFQKYGYKGSIGVIGKYSGRNITGYLSVAQLKQLKAAGWSLVNHSYYHQDAVTTYYSQNNLSGLESDILAGASFLEQNNLDTDPNWYIYPHGTTNQAIEDIVGKYYKFARTELTAPEVYPFGNPLAVKDFVVEDTTTPQQVEAAIADANTYHLTLLLTFHRIHASPTDKAGYNLSSLNQILDYLKKTNSHVMSLNQLDASNSVPINRTHIVENTPSQLNGPITEKTSFWSQIFHL
jgi:peptidoglycan/xylan/chitin deacetylase (PgdA/CDA1 family)